MSEFSPPVIVHRAPLNSEAPIFLSGTTGVLLQSSCVLNLYADVMFFAKFFNAETLEAEELYLPGGVLIQFLVSHATSILYTGPLTEEGYAYWYLGGVEHD